MRVADQEGLRGLGGADEGHVMLELHNLLLPCRAAQLSYVSLTSLILEPPSLFVFVLAVATVGPAAANGVHAPLVHCWLFPQTLPQAPHCSEGGTRLDATSEPPACCICSSTMKHIPGHGPPHKWHKSWAAHRLAALTLSASLFRLAHDWPQTLSARHIRNSGGTSTQSLFKGRSMCSAQRCDGHALQCKPVGSKLELTVHRALGVGVDRNQLSVPNACSQGKVCAAMLACVWGHATALMHSPVCGGSCLRQAQATVHCAAARPRLTDQRHSLLLAAHACMQGTGRSIRCLKAPPRGLQRRGWMLGRGPSLACHQWVAGGRRVYGSGAATPDGLRERVGGLQGLFPALPSHLRMDVRLRRAWQGRGRWGMFRSHYCGGLHFISRHCCSSATSGKRKRLQDSDQERAGGPAHLEVAKVTTSSAARAASSL